MDPTKPKDLENFLSLLQSSMDPSKEAELLATRRSNRLKQTDKKVYDELIEFQKENSEGLASTRKYQYDNFLEEEELRMLKPAHKRQKVESPKLKIEINMLDSPTE